MTDLGEEAVSLSLARPSVAPLYRLVALVLRLVGNNLAESRRGKFKDYVVHTMDCMPRLDDELLPSAVQVGLMNLSLPIKINLTPL